MSRAHHPSSANRQRRHALLALGSLLCAPAWTQPADAPAATLQVGPGRAVRTLAQAARMATDNTLIEVDAGEYRGDVAFWPQNRLHLRALGGRVRLLADGAAAQGKGLFVTRGQQFRVEGFDFEGAQVPSLNGAGIRVDAGSAHVVDCRFADSQCGVLTGNDTNIEVVIERCEFTRHLRADGRNHHVYAGGIGRLVVTGSHFQGAQSGHLLKSRARDNLVTYNRLVDGADGRASYELEFPNGGIAVVVGNLIQQGPGSENQQIVSFGAEGLHPGPNELHMAFNTLVNELGPTGVFLAVRPGTDRVRLLNNLLVGGGNAPTGGAEVRGNAVLALADLVDPAAGDYRVRKAVAARLRALDLPADAQALRPALMPALPRGVAERPPASVRLPGALPAQS